jgi:hypothetical protein
MNNNLINKLFKNINFENNYFNLVKFWGLGIGDWGLGIGDWAQSPIPNPQSPIPNPQFNILIAFNLDS